MPVARMSHLRLLSISLSYNPPMDSGDRAVSEPPAKREPDALDTWLAKEHHAWWRRWKWAVYIALAITGLRMLYSLLSTLYLMWIMSLSDIGTPLARSLVSYFGAASRTAVRIDWFLPELMLLIALVLAFTLLERLEVPSEIAITQKRTFLYNWQLSTTRRVFWTWIGLLVIAPYLVDVLLYLIHYTLPAWTSPSSFPGAQLNETWLIAVFFAWLALYFLVVEWGVLFTIKPLNRTSKWIWGVIAPPIVLFAVDKAIEGYERYWALLWLEAGVYDFSGRGWTMLFIGCAVTLLGIVALVLLRRRNSRMPENYTGASE